MTKARRTLPLIEHNPLCIEAPLSLAQQRLWFLYQFTKEKHCHNIVLVFELSGTIDAPLLNHAIDTVIERHGCFRMRINNANRSRLTQILQAHPSPSLRITDLSELSKDQQVEALRRCEQEELFQPFDITQSTTPRRRLLKFSDRCYRLVMTVHHIVFDGQSLITLTTELGQFYTAACAQLATAKESLAEKNAEEKPPFPLQYFDYACWEASWARRENWQSSTDFWKDYLHGYPQDIQWPATRKPCNAKTKTGQLHFMLDLPLVEKISRLARRHSMTLFSLLQAMYALMIFHHSRQPRFLLGTDLAGRFHPQVRDTMGFFINQLPLRCSVDPDQTMEAFITQSANDTRRALTHRRIPFDRLVAMFSQEREGDRPPLFKAKMNYQKRLLRHTSFGSAKLDRVNVLQHLGDVDLVLDLVHEEDGVHALFEYQRGLFTASTVQSLAHLWQRLLENLPDILHLPLAQVDRRLTQWKQQVEASRQESDVQARQSALAGRRRKPAPIV